MAERPKAAVVSTRPERPAKEKMSKKAQAKAAEAQKAAAPRRSRRGSRRRAQPHPRPLPRRRRACGRVESDKAEAQRHEPRTRQRPEVKELVEFLCGELVDDPDAVQVDGVRSTNGARRIT